MEMVPVTSSNVESVGYDAETNTLGVRFLNGGVYHYKGVSPQQFEALKGSPSVGQYLNAVIKPQFDCERVG